MPISYRIQKIFQEGGGSGERSSGGNGSGAVAYCGGTGGGSGYVDSSLLVGKHMYGYNVLTSDDEDVKAASGTCASAKPTADCAKRGNGYARITYLGAD